MKMEAYVLRTIDYKDHGKLVYMFTQHGLKSAIARGVKKMSSPLAHLVAPGNYIETGLTEGSLPTMKDATLLDRYAGLRADLVKSTIASAVHESILRNVTDHDDHARLFSFLRLFFPLLETTERSVECLLVFEIKMLRFLGYGPDFSTCAACGVTKGLRFDASNATSFCAIHHERATNIIDQRAQTHLKHLMDMNMKAYVPLAASADELMRASHVIDTWYARFLDYTSKSKEILYTIL